MKKVSLILSALLVTALMLSSFWGGAQNEVTIGKQVWMTKNLNVDKFRNGDPIPHAKTNNEWERAGENKQPAWCYYDNDPANSEKYGKLYNWYAVNDPRGLAPDGWHTPSDQEWTTLTDYLGGIVFAGTKMKSRIGWYKNGGSNNSSGFSALPGGWRDFYNDAVFGSIGSGGYWWSSTVNFGPYVWYRYLYDDESKVRRSDIWEAGSGMSVRCLRD